MSKEPQSRNEKLLHKLLGATVEVEEPQSRIEELLLQLIDQGGGGGGSDTPIQTQGNYKYRIYPDDTFEVWFKQTNCTVTIETGSGSLYRSDVASLALPSNLYNNYNCNIIHAEMNCAHNSYPVWGMVASIYETGINWYGLSGNTRNKNSNYTLTAYFFGTLTKK